MAQSLYFLGDLQISAPSGWLDITSQIDASNPPFSLAKHNGSGVIQFTLATYESGTSPNITSNALGRLLTNFAESKKLENGFNFSFEKSALLVAAASFYCDKNFIRIWYCSQGKDVLLVTYVCTAGLESDELPECEQIVMALKFRS